MTVCKLNMLPFVCIWCAPDRSGIRFSFGTKSYIKTYSIKIKNLFSLCIYHTETHPLKYSGHLFGFEFKWTKLCHQSHLHINVWLCNSALIIIFELLLIELMIDRHQNISFVAYHIRFNVWSIGYQETGNRLRWWATKQ